MYEELVKALHEHAKPDGWDCSVCMCRNAEDRGFYTCTEELAAKAADAIEELSYKYQKALGDLVKQAELPKEELE